MPLRMVSSSKKNKTKTVDTDPNDLKVESKQKNTKVASQAKTTKTSSTVEGSS